MAERLKVLISAYSIAPHVGSEPAVGWNVVKELSQHHDLWVITRADRAELIEPELQKNPLPNVTFIYYDLPYWMRFWRVKQRGQRLHYQLWQMAIRSVVSRLHQQIGFNLTHHVTYVKYWAPSFLSRLPLPFIWGPVGGGESIPAKFYKTLTPSGRRYEYVRNLSRLIGHYGLFVRMTARKATLGLATTRETATQMRRIGTRNVSVQPAIGMPDDEIAELGQVPARTEGPVRFLSLGRLLDWKGFHLGLQAYADVIRDYPESEFWIIGDGPQRAYLETLVSSLGITQNVKFLGKLPRQQVLERLGECDVLVHPSLHDSGGGVCLEAMAAGRPVICLDLGGPGEIVDDKTGFRVQALNPDQAVRDLAEAMRRIAHDAPLREQMGHAARERVSNHFAWGAKAQYLSEVYQSVVAGEMAALKQE